MKFKQLPLKRRGRTALVRTLSVQLQCANVLTAALVRFLLTLGPIDFWAAQEERLPDPPPPLHPLIGYCEVAAFATCGSEHAALVPLV